MSGRPKDIINMKAAINGWYKTNVVWLLLFIGALGNIVNAQNVPGCDPLGVGPTVSYKLTYDAANNRYTAWYIPSDNTLHRLVTGQFTIIAPNGFTTPAATGRDANFQITNLNGIWTDFVTDNEFITNAGQTSVPALTGLAVHQVGMAPTATDVDPDGTGPLTSDAPVVAGQAVPLFSFPGTGCASLLRVLVNGEPLQSQLLAKFGFNLNHDLSIQLPRGAFVAAYQRYCKNDASSSVTLVLPDVQNDATTLCASTATYTNNYFTQVLRNWNAATLPAGTFEVNASNRKWTGFTVSPSSLSANVSIDPVTGAYTLTFPTDGQGTTTPGSLTICNTIQDVCQTASDQACVALTWTSSGQLAVNNLAPVCLSTGTATLSLTATSGFANYSWSGPGLTSASTNPALATLTKTGNYSYTVVASNGTACSTVATTSVAVIDCGTDLSVVKTGPSTVNAGASVSYNLVITNNGPSAANGATVMDPATANFTVSGVSCTGASAGTSCPINPTLAGLQSGLTITTLPAGGSLTLVVSGTAGASGSIVNVASVTPPTGTTDTNPANNSATAITTITVVTPCPSNLIVLGTSHCNDGTYSVNYIATQGTTLLANAGSTVSAGVISGIPAGIVLSVTATNGLCTQISTANPPAGCTPCIAPMLTLGNPACSANGGFTVTYLTNGGAVSVNNGGIINTATHTISVPAGVTAVIVTATSSLAGCDKTTSFTIAAPTNCTPSTACVTMELTVLLEGPYNSTTHLMNTLLNSRGLLPGQSPIGMFAVLTPAGQPYNTAPWNYTGTERMSTYPADVVDWVLVSLRTDSLSTNTIFRVAGLLHNDGRITFLSPCFSIPDGRYFPVVEHRNHMGVMSSSRVPIVGNKLVFDFTAQDSYTATDPPSFGEIRIDNRWMLYGGDGKKDVYTENFDINFFDSKLWKDESGVFDQYRTGDFNMDADVNFGDSVLWNKNNGRYSKVPH
ncbi:hypothetical protein GCM10028825_54250 [Spirosoma agri]|uniref:DUF11 domain-containing protein n=2 Tax=Spirosoma agri TaxID=1987381 RepID=A0A6M0ITE8_9BACT|nr:DUF11 domain-containing protein [Spirosoma agri]